MWEHAEEALVGRHVVALDDGGALVGGAHDLIRLDGNGAEVWRWNSQNLESQLTAPPGVGADGGLWLPLSTTPAIGLSGAGTKLWDTVQYNGVNGFALGTDGKAIGGFRGRALLVEAGGAVPWEAPLGEDAVEFSNPSVSNGAAFGVALGKLVMIR